MKSAVYTLYSDINSDVWKDNYDFSKAIERFQRRLHNSRRSSNACAER